MARLKNVQAWMRWWGWTNNGEPGSVKHDADGKVIAKHGDNVWSVDLNRAIIRDERDQDNEELIDELERNLT